MNNTELLILGIITIYTSVIIVGLNKYESKIKDLRGTIEDYKRAHSLSKDVRTHYTQLQLNNQALRKVISDVDDANKVLQNKVRQLNEALAESRPLQYESSKHHDQNNSSL